MKVLINTDFIDAVTKKLRKAGTKVELSEDRIAAIREVNPDFITVIGGAETGNDPD
jgi:RNA:NAD 2'-phosphotransferase (TPT1/KptA family)